MLFERALDDEAVALIREHLAEELRSQPLLAQLADNIHAIAKQHGRPITLEPETGVLWWIHQRPAGKRWTSAEFRRWCEWVDERVR